MLEELQEIFNRTFGTEKYELSENTVIKEIPAVSSLSFLMVINEIEQYYNIEIPNSELRKFVTVKDVMRYLKRQV